MANLKLRGARATPRARLLRAHPYVPERAALPEFAVVPTQLSNWGNAQYGNCVSAEEAFAKAAWSVMCGLPETFITEQEVIRWARAHGFLNGAFLGEVMDAMREDGMHFAYNTVTDGDALGVDYSEESILQAAICEGPVKIAIDGDALPAAAGDHNGWFSTRAGNFGNTDHCVGLCGHGSVEFLFSKLGVPLVDGIPRGTKGYLLFTWSTIGFVTHAWLMGTCTEAWLRKPTTPGQDPKPVPPTPPIPPVPPTPIPPPCPPDISAALHLNTPLYAGDYDLVVARPNGNGVPAAFDWKALIALLLQLLPFLLQEKERRPDAIDWKALIALLLQFLPLLLQRPEVPQEKKDAIAALIQRMELQQPASAS